MLMLMTAGWVWSLRQAESIGELALRGQASRRITSNRIDSCAQMRVLDASKPVMKHEDDFEVEPRANLQPLGRQAKPSSVGNREKARLTSPRPPRRQS